MTYDILHNDTIIYQERTTKDFPGQETTYVNLMGGSVEFGSDSLGFFCFQHGRWNTLNNNKINIELTTDHPTGKKPYFFGLMDIEISSDSTITFTKRVDRVGNWRRVFFAKRIY